MKPLLKIEELKLYYPVGRPGIFKKQVNTIKAVDSVSFNLHKGKSMGLVGESGCGKTSLGRAILRVVNPTSGKVILYQDGQAIDITSLDRGALKNVWRHMQMIFQDPYSSLNPRMTVRDIVAEPLVANKFAKETELEELVIDMAIKCGLDIEQLSRYPHAFSGGQRQRIGIARALILHPDFIVCDEPVSSLDVSVQAQILNLLKELQQQLNLTYLFITHDLSVVAYICDHVAVMYLGKFVEVASTDKLFYSPKHPYTEALMSAIPSPNPEDVMEPILLSGERPNPANPPSGCRFHTRCKYATKKCRTVEAELIEYEKAHFVACHYAEKLNLKEHSSNPLLFKK
jgi:peptide/nickel transport system ATP-binding protein